ncbi:hypothetical protein [Paraliomyxa miuraensis]|uniref:hypothetical protein n=1 Tax=Paraliomyxa miuraensis TaxID=376150 RepID=UPI002251326F|nr:hypothetical protein [Paraliomyxa miuraensis]MCX4240075.1 hypothetical protein [Paraliomyxa miuraensis]
MVVWLRAVQIVVPIQWAAAHHERIGIAVAIGVGAEDEICPADLGGSLERMLDHEVDGHETVALVSIPVEIVDRIEEAERFDCSWSTIVGTVIECAARGPEAVGRGDGLILRVLRLGRPAA